MKVETGARESAPRAAGDPVVDFTLQGLDGQRYDSRSARMRGLLLVALFKTSCGTSRYAFPFFQRFHERYGEPSNGKFAIWGVSQDSAEETLELARTAGATFPLLVDEDLRVTEAYRPAGVPDLYLLGPEDRILDAVTGYFSTERYNALARRIADTLEAPYTPVVTPEDHAPALKPG